MWCEFTLIVNGKRNSEQSERVSESERTSWDAMQSVQNPRISYSTQRVINTCFHVFTGGAHSYSKNISIGVIWSHLYFFSLHFRIVQNHTHLVRSFWHHSYLPSHAILQFMWPVTHRQQRNMCNSKKKKRKKHQFASR